TFGADPRVELAAAADPRAEARERFIADFGGRAHDSVDALCADPGVDAIYVASPHQYHAEHVVAAASHGKHVLVEKPMAVSLEECDRRIEAAARHAVAIVVGPSHSFDAPIVRAKAIADGGILGRLRMITSVTFTD